MKIAELTGQLSYANKLKVGCIIVKDHQIISCGYNGTPAGWDNTCEQVEFVGLNEQVPSSSLMESMGYTLSLNGWRRVRTKPEVMHAEENAILKLARSGHSGKDSVLFCTYAPCIQCAKMIYGSGISKVFYQNEYRNRVGLEFLEKCNITVQHVNVV